MKINHSSCLKRWWYRKFYSEGEFDSSLFGMYLLYLEAIVLSVFVAVYCYTHPIG